MRHCKIWKDAWDSNTLSRTGEPRAKVRKRPLTLGDLNREIARLKVVSIPEWLQSARDPAGLAAMKANALLLFQSGSKSTFPAVIGYQYPPSYKRLDASSDALQTIQLEDLRLETRHHDKLLLLRLTEDPQRFIGLIAPVEDVTGSLELISIPFAEPDLLPFEVLQKGSILAVKEPYFGMSVMHRYAVCITHLSDMVRLSEKDYRVPPAWRKPAEPSAEAWKRAGDQACMSGNTYEALSCYNEASKNYSSINKAIQINLRNNRAILFFLSRRFENSMNEAQSVRNLDKHNTRALETIANASYHLDLFDECAKALADLREENARPAIIKELSKVDKRLIEQRGEYDFHEIISKCQHPHARLDIASFTSRVCIQPRSLHSRGLFLLDDVDAGDLILCEKAFAVADHTELAQYQRKILNLNTGYVTSEVQALLTQRVQNKVHRNGLFCAKVEDLWCRTAPRPAKEVQVTDGYTVIDSFLIQEVVELNSFRFPPVSTSYAHLPFGGRYCASTASPDLTEPKRQCYGLWPIAASLNHSCLPNAHISYVGNMLILRAGRALTKGTELLVNYLNSNESVERRQKYYVEHWSFRCDCLLCQADLLTPKQTRDLRDMMHESFHDSGEGIRSMSRRPTEEEIAQLQCIVQEIASTYDPRIYTGLPRTNLAAPTLHLFEVCALYKTPQGRSDPYLVLNAAYRYLHDALAIELHHNPTIYAELELLPGSLPQISAVDVIMRCADLFVSMHQLADAQMMKAQAALLYKIVCGEDATFAAKYSGFRCAFLRAHMHGIVEPADWDECKRRWRNGGHPWIRKERCSAEDYEIGLRG